VTKSYSAAESLPYVPPLCVTTCCTEELSGSVGEYAWETVDAPLHSRSPGFSALPIACIVGWCLRKNRAAWDPGMYCGWV